MVIMTSFKYSYQQPDLFNPFQMMDNQFEKQIENMMENSKKNGSIISFY